MALESCSTSTSFGKKPIRGGPQKRYARYFVFRFLEDCYKDTMTNISAWKGLGSGDDGVLELLREDTQRFGAAF